MKMAIKPFTGLEARSPFGGFLCPSGRYPGGFLCPSGRYPGGTSVFLGKAQEIS